MAFRQQANLLLNRSVQRLLNCSANPIATINQFQIEQVSTVKSLGLHIDENLTWECHINELSKKIAPSISVIKRICNIASGATQSNSVLK